MRKTEQYGLNQWDLPDRVRMEDFNSDNARIEEALGALSTRISGLDGQLGSLNGQLGGLGTQVGGLVTTETFAETKAALERTYKILTQTKLERSNIYNCSFVRSADNTYMFMDVSTMELKSYSMFSIYIILSGGKSESYSLNPYVSSGKISTGKCFSINGGSTQAIAILNRSSTASLLFFPLGNGSNVLGCVTMGAGMGVGCSECNFSQVTGFTLTPSSGVLDTGLITSVTINGIK